MLRKRPWNHVYEPLMPDVVVPKVHQNNRMQLCNLPPDSLRKNLAWWAVTQKNHKTVTIGGWVLAQDNTVRN